MQGLSKKVLFPQKWPLDTSQGGRQQRSQCLAFAERTPLGPTSRKCIVDEAIDGPIAQWLMSLMFFAQAASSSPLLSNFSYLHSTFSVMLFYQYTLSLMSLFLFGTFCRVLCSNLWQSILLESLCTEYLHSGQSPTEEAGQSVISSITNHSTCYGCSIRHVIMTVRVSTHGLDITTDGRSDLALECPHLSAPGSDIATDKPQVWEHGIGPQPCTPPLSVRT